MELYNKLLNLSQKISQQAANISTEEATKNAFIMPFINTVLGYDVFDPAEVIPEYVTDIGTKKGEKIDYAILKNGAVQILIECKKIGEALNINHASQLFRYFHVTSARISILTNGQIYKFFTDLDAPNKMDEKPFLELDLLNLDENIFPEIKKLTKEAFDVDSIINAAGELRYIGEIKKIIAEQFLSPNDDFVRYFSQKVYDGINTQKVREQFSILTKKALNQFLNDKINDRLKTAINISPLQADLKKDNETLLEIPPEQNNSNIEPADIITTEEELEALKIVKAIARKSVTTDRVVARDSKSYFAIFLDDNNRKPICRLYLQRQKKYIGLFDQAKNETKMDIESLDNIYDYADRLNDTIKSYFK